VLNCDIGGADAPSFAELRERHDAVLVATGVYKARAPGAGRRARNGCGPALDYLTASNRKGLGDAVPTSTDGALNAKGRDVVVVGGGDTAMDCVRTAVRQGAKSVSCLYRRDEANMPGSMREVANAEEEGVEFVWLSAPEAFLGDDGWRRCACSGCASAPPTPPAASSPEPVPGSSTDGRPIS
jgi:glutamate synthase (NADPH) small chain